MTYKMDLAATVANPTSGIATLQYAARATGAARYQEYKLLVGASSSGAFADAQIHLLAYQKAVTADNAAEKALEKALLNTPTNVQALADITMAAQDLIKQTAAIKQSAAQFDAFAKAADKLIGVLGFLAAL